MPKILHIADLHLDSRFVGFSLTEASKRREQLRSVFKNALAYAKSEGCALTLISGDLFDGEYYTSDTLRFLADCFSSMPEHKFVIAPGNHDPFTATSPYRYADFPENVCIFKEKQLSRIDFDDIGVTVFGYAFTSDYYGENPLDGFSIAPETENFTVLCAHTELDNAHSPYAPIPTSALASSGLDYAALGHIHKSEGTQKAGKTVYAYSGCIAGRDFSEYGEKGGIIASLDRVGRTKTVNAVPVRFCPWTYGSISVSVTGMQGEEEIDAAVKDKLRAMQTDSNLEYITRITLTGESCISLDAEALLAKYAPFGVKSVKNEAFFVHSSLQLENDYSLRGEFYRTLVSMLNDPEPKIRKRAELALKYGLDALSGSRIEI